MPDRRAQRSYSFQKREEVSVSQILRRTSNSVAPVTVEAMTRTHPLERRHDYDMASREMNDIAYRGLPNSLLRYHDDELSSSFFTFPRSFPIKRIYVDYPAQSVSYEGTRYYDPVQETDILGDDISEGQSDVYGPGTYNPGSILGFSSSISSKKSYMSSKIS
ncbi:hypothetical protein Y032_0083g1676 [Ancylostoma ceylanicum]|uniref:Uncharacterized protein n=1 Tax=Ancylostoma ceylanicum TaxID=53326 RepID=A0A016TQH3_9BILA|nr:hypothetical protein Y032_0083g1676 [Ancylostoma ceylanicum]